MNFILVFEILKMIQNIPMTRAIILAQNTLCKKYSWGSVTVILCICRNWSWVIWEHFSFLKRSRRAHAITNQIKHVARRFVIKIVWQKLSASKPTAVTVGSLCTAYTKFLVHNTSIILFPTGNTEIVLAHIKVYSSLQCYICQLETVRHRCIHIWKLYLSKILV